MIHCSNVQLGWKLMSKRDERSSLHMIKNYCVHHVRVVVAVCLILCQDVMLSTTLLRNKNDYLA